MDNKKTNTLDIKSFGLNLYEIMKEKGLTNEELAEMLGVSTRIVYNWKNGEKLPGLERAIELVRVLGVSLDSILRSR